MNHANFAQTTLASAVTTTDGTSIVVTSETSFPAVQFIISIDTEAMLVTAIDTVTWTVTRGYEGSTAATHLNGAAIFHDISAAEADSIATKLPLAGGTLTGNLIMDNVDVTLVKLLTLHGEIDDVAGAATINWNAGAAHKVTLGAPTTLAFTGSVDEAPTMSAANAPSGYVVSTSSEVAGKEGWKAFDNVFVTQSELWGTFNVPSVSVPQWVQMQFPSAKTISAYTITNKQYSAGGDAPTNWTLQGSNNGTDWTVLDTRFGVTWASGSLTQSFSIAAPTSYLYYRLSVTYVATVQNGLYIAEIQFLTGIVNPTAPCFLTLKLVQDATGGRAVTWPATVKGTPNLNAAASSTSIVLLYWDGTNYYVVNEGGAGEGGAGDVVGPTSAVDAHAAVFDGATGKLLKDGGALVEGVWLDEDANGDLMPGTALISNATETIATLGLDADLATLSLPANTTITAAGAALLDDASATVQIATLGLDADIATLALPANTTISAAGAAILDDADAAAQLATLGTAAYSEGTWTSTLNGFTIVGAAPALAGTYKRIGNMVFITCTISAGAGGNTSVAAGPSSYISGLPFTLVQSVVGTFVTISTAPSNLGLGFMGGGGQGVIFPTGFAAQTIPILFSALYGV